MLRRRDEQFALRTGGASAHRFERCELRMGQAPHRIERCERGASAAHGGQAPHRMERCERRLSMDWASAAPHREELVGAVRRQGERERCAVPREAAERYTMDGTKGLTLSEWLQH